MTEQKTDSAERRTSGVQQRGRASRVVNSIHEATREVLSEMGYAGLRIDEVARRADVNKTTVYRRWPTKAELVADTIKGTLNKVVLTDTGSLRRDLKEYLKLLAQRSTNAQWRGILLTLNSNVDQELELLAKELRQLARSNRTKLIQRGIDRGELPKGINPELVADVVSAPVLYRALHLGEPVDDAFIDHIIDIGLAGAAACALRPVAADSSAT